jgi:hypothetical protein
VKKLNTFLLVVVASAVMFSCKKDTTPPVDLGYEYYPVKEGFWVIYDVDSTFYNLFTHQKEHYTFQVMEVTDSIIPDNAGRSMMRKKRFYRDNSSQAWEIKRVWSAVRTTERVESNEENVKFVRLTFPVRKSKTWNGNAMNTEPELIYKYTSANTSIVVNGITIDSSATVLQEADSNLIEKRYKSEIYGKHIGMIYKAFVDVAVQDTVIDFSKPFDERINTGVKYYYKLNSYSK